MSTQSHQLHVYFFPLMAPGHMIPLVDMARQFSRHNVKATIVLTSHNETRFSASIEQEKYQGFKIDTRVIQFPFQEVGLPPGCENLASITSTDMSLKFLRALNLLQKPIEKLLEQDHPDCLVADIFFPWTTEVAGKLGIPRLTFHGAGFFPLCVYHSLTQHKPYQTIKSDSEAFVVPGLPHAIAMTKRQLPDYIRKGSENVALKIISSATNSEWKSYGVIVNSFKELEPDYVEHYKMITGNKAWHVGPVSLCNKGKEDKSRRANEDRVIANKCSNWLSSQKPETVLYLSFGSMSFFSAAQLHEIAMALEICEQPFLWVLPNEKIDDSEKSDWIPEGFESRMENKGLIIRGWAPQVLILDHEATGGFVTHCGWNSLLEGVAAGVPMVTWPISSEQFDNEKLLTKVLKIGAAVGVEEWTKRLDVHRVCIKRDKIIAAINKLMVGEEADEMRRRAKTLKDMAKKAVEKGGSSHIDLNSLLDELRSLRADLQEK